ncbi:MAG: folylpolyglutamate synthase/dihydrofolate synthase family protein [Desulfurivibrionaceae bacterium]|nr:bifunctional folylpolyglutamate synthase/dihydrofolate synthase [Desulfobulbales bacterium]MDT8334249.1 folylpolyglutamate synthase/dihydrofolate synthase family protein [Desulfurivibrionaceae bacterium]
MDYRQAWSYLDDLQFFKIKLGLDSMSAFLESVGRPQEKLRFIHVAGTNGKGSVAAHLLTILAAAGYKVGLYTSPHLSSVRERFRINHTYISEREFAEHATAIRNSLAGNRLPRGPGDCLPRITYFEFTTALALLWFAEQQVDLVILEVGLGGRLDATNVVTPLVAIITNVSMDHEAHLGNTLAEVAGEKAGIIKPGVPVVSGVVADESLAVVEGSCRERGAPLYLLGRDFDCAEQTDGRWTYRPIGHGKPLTGLRGGLAGGYQRTNGAIALAALEILGKVGFPVAGETLRAALPEVIWPGRLESFCLSEPGLRKTVCPDPAGVGHGYRRYLLDGAHNPAGVASLVGYLRSRDDFDKLVVVWASMADKDYGTSLAMIAALGDILVFTRPEEERSASPGALAEALAAEHRGKTICVDGVGNALEKARQITGGNDLICVAGSLYLVGAVRTLLLGELVG